MVDSPRRPFLHRAGHWAAELILVFLGAYASFWLTNYQQHRADARRHDQILAFLEQEMKEGLENTQENERVYDQKAAQFRSDLAAGKMPEIRPFSFSTDYS